MFQFLPKPKVAPQPATGQRQLLANLAVNTPGDHFEQEADRAADQVIAGRSRPSVNGMPPGTPQAGAAHAGLALSGTGRPLEPTLRHDMERRFGHDFGRVRVHSGMAAEQSARDLDANAFTIGPNIVFGADRFAPTTESGRRLLAHELTHVVQQSQSAMPSIQREPFRSNAEKNDTWKGQETGPLALPGATFTSDPYDHTVVFERPDGSGVQWTYQIVQTDDGPRERLVDDKPVQLSRLRVQALKRINQVGGGEKQEGSDGPRDRMKKDAEIGTDARAGYSKAHPDRAAEYAAYLKALVDYQASEAQAQKEHEELPPAEKKKPRKPAAPPAIPTGFPANKRSTLCIAWPGKVYRAAGGSQTQGFAFTPPTDLEGWRTLATNPEGPRPGDIYYLWDIPNHQVAHMGVFKSAAPVPDQPDLQRWVVTDGGQGEYTRVNTVNERSRIFNKKTGIFSKGDVAEAGQGKGDRRLVGWVDIDAQAATEPQSNAGK